MKKTIMISMVLASAFLVGCGNASGPETTTGGEENTSVASFNVVKGTYVVGDHYLDIDANGKLSAYTYFDAAECVEKAVMGEKNHALDGKTLTAKAKEFTLMHDGGHLVWAFTTDAIDKVKYLKGGSTFSAGSGLNMNDFAVGTTKSMQLPATCDANASTTTLRKIIANVGTFYDAQYSEANESNRSSYAESHFSDSNMTFDEHDFNGTNFDVNVTSRMNHYPLHYSDDNKTLHISDETNVTCTLGNMNARMGSLTLSCAEDANLTDTKSTTLWTTLEKAKANKVHH